MHLEINSEHIDSTRVKQIIKFYLSRLDDQITRLTIYLDSPQPADTDHFQVTLAVLLNNGRHLELQEVQGDLILATQRSLDRLVRQLQMHRRRQRFLKNL